MANLYFLFMACIVMIPGLSPTLPITSVLPLLFVISVTAAKQGWEDYQRFLADSEINRAVARVVCAGGTVHELPAQEVLVGDVLQVLPGDEFPCDMVLLEVESPDPQCYITTANIDGEGNLKARRPPPDLPGSGVLEQARKEGGGGFAGVRVACSPPSATLYDFTGVVHVPATSEGGEEAGEVRSPIDNSQLLLKGSVLRGSAAVVAVAVYTGRDSKILLNQRPVPSKVSSVERRLNTLLLCMMLVLAVLCAGSAALKYYLSPAATRFTYAGYREDPTQDQEPETTGENFLWRLWDFLVFVILYSNLIPISLYVTLEVQKLCGALLIGWDLEMYDDDIAEPVQARCSDLNEELGQVEFVFADKTGTLTQNTMVFKACSVAGTCYWVDEPTNSLVAGVAAGSGVASSSPGAAPPQSKQRVRERDDFFRALSLCHTVNVTETKDPESSAPSWTYASSSPDEDALVLAAAQPYGRHRLTVRTEQALEVRVTGASAPTRYKVLHVCEFDSVRARMSVLVEDRSSGVVTLLCKGADSTIMARLRGVPDGFDRDTAAHIHRFSRRGLRTLAVARRILSEDEAAAFLKDLAEAKQLIDGRSDAVAALNDRLETELELLGITAVEDKLQEGIVDTMKLLRAAGCRVWVLTGDKVETAVDISLSAGHTTTDMKVFRAVGAENAEDCEAIMQRHLAVINKDKGASGRASPAPVIIADAARGQGGRRTPAADMETGRYGHALVLDGRTAEHALDTSAGRALVLALAQECICVVGCRLSPKQKAEMVRLVKSSKGERTGRRPITLAIGDGANDVPMIREAHVGVAILGREGRQAARSSDYAFGKFRYLSRLMLVHGHYSYHRATFTICFFFYKGVLLITPSVLFGTASLFSGQSLFDSWLLLGWNMVFTAGPVAFFGMLEKDLEPDVLLQNPTIYSSMVGNRQLRLKSFGRWILLALVQSCLCYFGVIYCLNPGLAGAELSGTANVTATMLDWAPRQVGGDIRLLGFVVYTCCFLTATLTIAMDARSWNWLFHVGVWLTSIALYATWLACYALADYYYGWSAAESGAYGALAGLLFADVWKAIGFVVLATFTLELALVFGQRVVSPTEVQRAQATVWEAQGRHGWFAESCHPPARTVNKADPERVPLLKGARSLAPPPAQPIAE